MISPLPLDQDFSPVASRIAGGAIVLQPFGPAYALVGRPDIQTVRRINRLAGRPADDAGSLVTCWCRIPTLFDWSALPDGLDSETVMEIIDALLADGPFGFRGPASHRLPGHLVTEVDGMPTARLIGPGYACDSGPLIDAEMAAVGTPFLAIGATARGVASPATGLIAVRHRDEAAAQARYPRHAAKPVTVLAFHRFGRTDRESRPTLVVERQGSYPLDALAALVACWGFGIDLAPAASANIPVPAGLMARRASAA